MLEYLDNQGTLSLALKDDDLAMFTNRHNSSIRGSERLAAELGCVLELPKWLSDI